MRLFKVSPPLAVPPRLNTPDNYLTQHLPVADPSISAHLRQTSVILERPRVPFRGGQGADFLLKELPRECHGFKMALTIPEQPYWRAGFVLAPDDYIREGRSDVEITQYFLFHVGRGSGKNPTERTELQYQAYYNRCPLTHPTSLGFEPVNVVEICVELGSEPVCRVAVGSAGVRLAAAVDRTYLRYLYVLAWADGFAPFRIPVELSIS